MALANSTTLAAATVLAFGILDGREDPMTYVPNQLLSRLVGGRLVAVTFVLDDYLQLQFDDARMNVDVWPEVIAGGRTWRVRDLGYGDALRQLCGSRVSATSEQTGDGLRIVLDAGQIHINPSADEVGVEIALLQMDATPGLEGPGEWMCWRVGEESFEHLA